MKKNISILIFLFILLSFSLCYAMPFPDKNTPEFVNWTYGEKSGTDIIFYYAPSLTSISPQGELETWIKIVEKDHSGSIATISIKHYFVNPSFEKFKTTENIEYTASGTMLADHEYSLNTSWTNMPPGTPFEITLQNAWHYAKDNLKIK